MKTVRGFLLPGISRMLACFKDLYHSIIVKSPGRSTKQSPPKRIYEYMFHLSLKGFLVNLWYLMHICTIFVTSLHYGKILSARYGIYYSVEERPPPTRLKQYERICEQKLSFILIAIFLGQIYLNVLVST